MNISEKCKHNISLCESAVVKACELGVRIQPTQGRQIVPILLFHHATLIGVVWLTFKHIVFFVNLAPAIEPSRGIEAGRSCNPVAHPRQELFSCVACAVSEILVCEWKVINVLRLIRQVNGSVVISGG